MQQGRPRAADQPGRPAHLAGVLGQRGGRGERLERQQGRRAGSFALEIAEGGARVLEALDHDPLQPIPEHGLDRGLEPVRNLEEVRHRPDHAAQIARGGPREHGAHSGAVSLALPLQPLERLQGRPARRQLHPELGERLLGRGPDRLPLPPRGLDLVQLRAQQRELGARSLPRQLQALARGRERIGLGAGRGELGREPVGAAIDLGPPLAQLTAGARQVGARARHPDLLEPEGLEALPALAERGPAGLDLRLDPPHLLVLPSVPLPGLVERTALLVALGREGDPPLREPADLFLEPGLLREQILDLEPHLLPALEQSLRLALDLLHRLPEVSQPVLGVLDRGGLQGLPPGEGRDPRSLLLLGLAQRLHLASDRLVLGGQGRVVGGEQCQVEALALGLERLVLLGLPGLALDRRELAPHLFHHVAQTLEVESGRVELALGLGALLLVAGDAGRLLDEHPALPRLGGQHVVEALLVHERVGLGVDPGPREEILDVPQAAHVGVEQVLALTGAVQASGHRHLAPRHAEAAVVVEHEADLGHADHLPRGGAVEDDVLHLVAAEGLRALLTEGPADGVGHVGLAAAVGTDDARDAREDLYIGLLGERLEAVDQDRFESHDVDTPAGRVS